MKIVGQNLEEASYNLLGKDIKMQIDYNNQIIEGLLSPNKFTLNNTVAQLLKENEELQKQCEHNYQNGYCIYCYKEEPHN